MALVVVPPSSPVSLLCTRLAQLIFALTYFCLLIYCFMNRGWWLHLSWPIGLGCSASIITMALDCGNVWRYHLNSTLRSRRDTVALFRYLRVAVEVSMFCLWTATLMCMLLPKGKDFRFAFVMPPFGFWGAAGSMAILEMISFFYSAVLVTKAKDAPNYVGSAV